MLKSDIYIGSINTIVEGKVKLYQNNSPLLSLGDGNYINLEWVTSIKDKMRLYKGMVTGKYSEDLVITSSKPNNGIYVDRNSLIPYYGLFTKGKVSLGKANRDISLDPRIPSGIEMQSDGTALIYVRKPNPKRKVS